MVHDGDTFTVYILENLVNGKRYVGCTRTPIKSRMRSGNGYTHNSALNADIQKYGWENFTHTVIASSLDYETASNLEVELIRKNKTTVPDCGYNRRINKGAGLCGYQPKPHDGWNKGKKLSEETKIRMSKSHKGIKQSTEWIEARFANLRGRTRSEEHTAKLLPVLKTNSEKAKRPCKTTNVETGEVKYYPSLKEAGLATGCAAVSHAIKIGAVRNGYRFEYA